MTAPITIVAIDMPVLTDPACARVDPDTFFPPPGVVGRPSGGARPDPTAAAKAICADCPDQRPCLEYALAQRIPYGVWGGQDEPTRQQLLRGRR